MFCGVENIGRDDTAGVETDYQVFGAAFAEQAVLIMTVGPGALTVFDADPPRLSEHRTNLALRGLSQANHRYRGAGKFPADRGASGYVAIQYPDEHYSGENSLVHFILQKEAIVRSNRVAVNSID